MRFCFGLIFAAAVAFSASGARAALTTTPYLFTEQSVAGTGQLEWDELSGGVIAPAVGGAPGAFGTATPDAADNGPGQGALTIDFVPQPFDGPPVPLQTSTENFYTGGTLGDFDVSLTGLDSTEAFTTVVLQLSVLGSFTPDSILLDGTAPTTLVDRGVAEDVEHNADGGPGTGAAFDTRFYWAEWQVPAESDYLLEFSNPFTHTSLTQVRVDYFNTAAPFAAVAAGAVPEPTTVALTGLLACSVSLVGVRRR